MLSAQQSRLASLSLLPKFGFPKSSRILRRSDFRKVYDEGLRWSCPFFAAFCLARADQVDGPKIGFTVSKALGHAVVRNRMKRRMREVVRRQLAGLPAHWAIVFNPRKPVLAASCEALSAEVRKLFERCANS